MIHFVLPRGSDFTIRDYLLDQGSGLAGRASILHYEDLMARADLSEGAYVLTALDQLYPEDRPRLAELCDRLSQAGPAVRLLNSPRATLLRFELLDELYRRGLNRHRAVRAVDDPRALRFPVFLHDEHRHNGALSDLLRTPAELSAALARLIVRGHRPKDLLVIEFYDTSDAEGRFRKYDAFVVGSRIISRGLDCGRNWMLKGNVSECTASDVAEAQTYVFQNPHERELRLIFEFARVEYGRIDYAMKDDVIETWEINLHPTIGRSPRPHRASRVPEELRPIRREMARHFYRLFQEALEAIDVVGEAPNAIPTGSARHARPLRTIRQTSRMRAAPRALRPLKPLIDRIAGGVSPVLVGLARRFR